MVQTINRRSRAFDSLLGLDGPFQGHMRRSRREFKGVPIIWGVTSWRDAAHLGFRPEQVSLCQIATWLVGRRTFLGRQFNELFTLNLFGLTFMIQ